MAVWIMADWLAWPVLSFKLRYIVGFKLVEMAISTNPKPTTYRNFHENLGPSFLCGWLSLGFGLFQTVKQYSKIHDHNNEG